MTDVPLRWRLPVLARRPLPHHPTMYAPLALLHLSLLARIALGDGVGWEPAWRWSGVTNVVAVLGFAASATFQVVRPGSSTVDLRRAVGAVR